MSNKYINASTNICSFEQDKTPIFIERNTKVKDKTSKKQVIEPNSYIKTYQWMVELKLNISELFVFSLFYSFYENNQIVKMSSGYISSRTGMSPRNVMRCIQKLEDLGLIKNKSSKGKIYEIEIIKTYDNLSQVNDEKNAPTYDNLSQQPMTDCHSTYDRLSYNKKRYNKDDKLKRNYKEKKSKNSFNKFAQNNYDFKKLEETILSN